MRPFIACAVAVLLWSGAEAFAQAGGQGKGKNQTQVKQNAPKAENAQKDAQKDAKDLAGAAQKEAGQAGETVKRRREGAAASRSRQGGPADKDANRSADVVEKGKALGKEHAKQAQAFQKQIRHEDAKHMERHARLVRIRELAAQKGDAEMVARVEKLMEKEQQVYSRKVQRMQEQPKAAQQSPAGAQPSPAPESKPDSNQGPQAAPNAEKEKTNQGPSK